MFPNQNTSILYFRNTGCSEIILQLWRSMKPNEIFSMNLTAIYEVLFVLNWLFGRGIKSTMCGLVKWRWNQIQKSKERSKAFVFKDDFFYDWVEVPYYILITVVYRFMYVCAQIILSAVFFRYYILVYFSRKIP